MKMTEKEHNKTDAVDFDQVNIKYRQLIDFLPDATIVHCDGVILHLNPVALRLLGNIHLDLYKGRQILDIVHPDYRRLFQTRMDLLMMGRRLSPTEMLIYLPGENELDIEVNSACFEQENQQFVHTVIRDITQRKQTHAILQQIARSAALPSGDKYFYSLMEFLRMTLKVDSVLVGRMIPNQREDLEVISARYRNDIVNATRIRIKDGALQAITAQHDVAISSNVRRKFPKDAFLEEHKFEGLVGVPILSANEKQLGILAVMTEKPIADTYSILSVLQIFASQTAAILINLQNRDESLLLHDTYSLMEDVVLELDSQFIVRKVSDSWESMMRDTQETSPLNRSILAWPHPDYSYYLSQNLTNLLSEEKARVILQFPVPVPNSPNKWVEGKFIPIFDAYNRIKGVRGMLRDVTLEHFKEKQYNFFAYHDNLTGLPNRNRMEENLFLLLNRAKRSGNKMAIGFIDMDDFHEINNLLGHKTGDRILMFMAERLQEKLGAGENLYRWGGDKFVVILEDFTDIEVVRRTARELVEVCNTPILIDDQNVRAAFSIGFTIFPDDGTTLDSLIGQADRAMVMAKKNRQTRYQLTVDIPEKSFYKSQIILRNNIALAIENNSFEPFFQPKIKNGTRKIVGMEALARWHVPEVKKQISPATFIPIAENMGLITPLGEQILEKSLEFLNRLKQNGYYLSLSVNISRQQLFLENFEESLHRLLDKHNIRPFELILEITESIAVLDMGQSLERLNKLREGGFVFSIDDFGTGYSSLSQLHELPVSELKIDQSFVRRIHTREGIKVVEAITNMGHALNMSLVAEGVEDLDSVERLEALGIQLFQGNYFSKPLSQDDMMERLRVQKEEG